MQFYRLHKTIYICKCLQVIESASLSKASNGQKRGSLAPLPHGPYSKYYKMDNVIKEDVNGILTSKQAAAFLGVSLSYLYKLTAAREIPFFKPNGKMCYFEKGDLVAWIKRGRVSSETELEQQAQTYCMQKGGVR